MPLHDDPKARGGLAEEQYDFLLSAGGITAEEFAASLERVARGDFARAVEATRQAALDATLSADEVMTRLRVGPAMLRRLSERGYLHTFQNGSEVL